MCRYSFNTRLTERPQWESPEYASFLADDLMAFHRSVPGYAPTPLIRLPHLAASLGVREVFVKDEAHRFGLKAFKAMGASYAIYRFIKQEWEKCLGVRFEIDNLYDRELLAPLNLHPFCTATDGNHGRAVAWFADKICQRAVIYVPACTVTARIDNIRKEGAEVVVVDGSYDDAVRMMARDAGQQGWHIISDISFGGYTQVPAWIMAAYTTMFREIDEAIVKYNTPDFTHIFLQAGVGSFAGAAAWYYFKRKSPPFLISVEPLEADCVLESISIGDGEPKVSRGSQRTIMAGLNCGTVSMNAWPLIRDRIALAVAISDDYCRQAMRKYYYPAGGDERIVSGESGAAGLAGLLAVTTGDGLRDALNRSGIGSDSVILLFNTEGDTDPAHFESVISG